MKTMPTMRSAMTPFPYSIDLSATLIEAKEMMEKYDIHHIPVKEKGKLGGILSARELELAIALLADENSATEGRGEPCVKDAYHDSVLAVGISATVVEVLELMIENRVGSVLVLKHDKLVGIFTLSDVCQQFREHLLQEFGTDDDEPPQVA